MEELDNLSRVSSPVFIQIFKNFNANELLRLRLTSRRIYRRIHRNIGYLERPGLDHIGFKYGRRCLRNGGRINKFFQIELKKSAKRPSRMEEEELHQSSSTNKRTLKLVREYITQFKLTNSISFNRCDITSEFIRLFLHPTVDLSGVQKISFELCQLNSTKEELHELIRRTSCSDLSVEFCSGCSLSNELLQYVDQLKCLRAQIRTPLDCVDLDDTTLKRWCKQATLPTTIDLSNVPVRFTVDGMIEAIQALQVYSKKCPSTNITWNLGECTWTIQELLVKVQQGLRNQSAQCFLCLRYIQRNRIRIKINFNQTFDEFKYPLKALEQLVNSFETENKEPRVELCFSLFNRRKLE